MALGIPNLSIGMFTDHDAHTGCTVLLPPAGTIGGIAVRGGAPGTREAAVLGPNAANTFCHGVVLCGSSLFGLRAADGVVDWCEQHQRGLALPLGCFPIVGAAVVLDKGAGGPRRINASAGWEACATATTNDPPEGAIGVGTGCTVGKEAGRGWAAPGGQGIATVSSGDVVVSALMGVNAFGSVYDERGQLLAGCRAPETVPRYPHIELSNLRGFSADGGGIQNTIIGCVVTNAALDKTQICRVADLSHSGIARSVSPAHTNLDGDALFALSIGQITANVDLVAHLGAAAVAAAIRSAVRQEANEAEANETHC